jgi:hypothetical protein
MEVSVSEDIYTPDELGVLVRDGLNLSVETFQKQVMPKYPTLHLECTVLNSTFMKLQKEEDFNVIQGMMQSLQMAALAAKDCNCDEPGCPTRMQFMADIEEALACGASHIHNTIRGKMIREYNVTDGDARRILFAWQMNLIPNMKDMLEQYGRREDNSVDVDVPDTIEGIDVDK